ncbi:hypothetical protein C0995_003033 [Termitomyces sp. Mi166|nr:hypothetical protein C0995_003033 [Termitomyces sp. Mi166\
MAICQFFIRGNCRFGVKCRNSHDVPGNSLLKPPFTEEILANDLTPQRDKPLWPLSTYGPARHEPNLLANLDTSPEELRYQAFISKQEGKAELYPPFYPQPAYETQKIAAAEQVFENARNNLNQVYQTAVNQCVAIMVQTATGAGNIPSAPSTSSSVFGAPATTTTAFRNPGATSAFGQTAFGNANNTSAFGSGSTNPTSAFGSTNTNTNNTGTSAFGASNTATSSAFSNPTSAFGTSTFGQPSFGQTSAPGPSTSSAFGQSTTQPTSTSTSAFGQPSTSTFGQPSAFGQAAPSSIIKPASGAFGGGGGGAFSSSGGGSGGFSAFAGQPSAFGSGAVTSVFGQGTFGGPATNQNQSSSAFGSAAPASGPVSAFGNPNPVPATSAFGSTASAPTSAFGNPNPAPATSVFGTPSVLGAPSTTSTSAFGSTAPVFNALSQSTTSTGTFGSALTNSNAPSNPFTNPNPTNPISSPFAPASASSSSNSAFPIPIQQTQSTSHPPLSAFPMASPSTSINKSTTPDFAGARSLYQQGLTPYDQLLPADYAQRLPEGVRSAFEGERFEWGSVPEWVPPMEVR